MWEVYFPQAFDEKLQLWLKHYVSSHGECLVQQLLVSLSLPFTFHWSACSNQHELLTRGVSLINVHCTNTVGHICGHPRKSRQNGTTELAGRVRGYREI
ncbi:hypothetical protein DPEC_G00214290 [Dallia pectoralis]|uniref:Uncharacterized protein n=1 Tax=Dallia pectoralis TaxID=75939 RepID=A0ACC2G202_DALPE|nr:hypothetical protein DPEC_G00214290 [Dallia pectoralis]